MESSGRNKRIAQNIKVSSLMRFTSIGINLLLVPMLLQYLGERDYGIWLTISSFLGWSALLDLGMGNGLKNRLSESLANGKQALLRSYTSSAYIIIAALASAAFAIFAAATFFLDWRSILNAVAFDQSHIRLMLILFFLFFCVKLVLHQVVNIASARQQTSLGDVVNVSINILLLVMIYALPYFTGNSLLAIVLVFGLAPIAVLLIVSIYAFTGPFKDFRPSITDFSFDRAKDVMSLGSRFFIIQLAGIILFSTDNLIISHYIDPVAVTGYNISFRYFGIIITFFSILSTPMWPAYTEAYQRGDMEWIKRITRNLVKVWGGVVLLVATMLMLSPYAYKLWVGEEVSISWSLSAIMAAYVVTITWGTIFVTFINSTGKLRLQLYFSVLAGLLNIPLSIFFIQNTQLGAAGVMLATIICLSYGPIVSVMQYRKIVNNTARGIWSQ